MGMRQRKCPRCKKRRPFEEGAAGNKLAKASRVWEIREGVLICVYCIKKRKAQ